MSEFKINSQKPDSSNTVTEVYTFWGDHEFEDTMGFPKLSLQKNKDVFSMQNAYAVKISKGNKTNYYVKRGKYGKLYNPIGLYSEGNVTKQNTRHGQSQWSLKTTSEKVFNYYINFLKTKNSAWLNNAEREV